MKRYGLALLPLALAGVLMLAWQSGLAANPVLFLRADVGTAFLLTGALAAVVTALAVRVAHLRSGAAERAAAAERALQADEHRRFMRRLDHEVKNPLTALQAGLANLGAPGDEATMRSIRHQVDRLARLTADLRKLADLEARPLEAEEVDVAALLEELTEMVRERPDAAARRMRLVLPQAPWPLPPVLGDRDLLFLAFHNLLDNALKFSGPDGTVELRATDDAEGVTVSVADTGPGVPEAELPHLGEELYRGSLGLTVEGSGLGLALVRAIVKRHNGTVSIRSRVGGGTVVAVRLPV